MNKRYWLIAIPLLAILCLWLAPSSDQTQASGKTTENSRTKASPSGTTDQAHPPSLRTKVAQREKTSRQTHSPERLKEFMLPTIALEGLSLQAATQKLMAAYQQACQISGETALPLTFKIPPEATRLLNVRLPAGNLNSSVQLLATLYGMKATRQGSEYRFEPLADEYKAISRKIEAPPDLNEALSRLSGLMPEPSSDPMNPDEVIIFPNTAEGLEACGIQLAPSTRLTLSSSGELTLETTSTADAESVAALVKFMSEKPRNQMYISTKLMELPSGADWLPADSTNLTDEEVQKLMRQSALTKGTDLKTLPSLTLLNGHKTTFDQTREVIWATDDSGHNFDKREVGKTLELKAAFLGFGREIEVKYQDTTFEFDKETMKLPTFTDRAKMNSTSFNTDGQTRFIKQTRPDGTETLLLITSQIIDSTGRPVR